MSVIKVYGGFLLSDGTIVSEDDAREIADLIFDEDEYEYCQVCMENDMCRREYP